MSVRQPKLPNITSKLDASFARALAELIGIWKGERGDKLDRVITLRDLQDSGIADATTSGGISYTPPSSSTDLTIPDGTYAPAPDPTTPPAPTGFTVTAGIYKVIIDWNTATEGNHAYTEIWRNSVDDLGTAGLVGSTTTSLYNDDIDGGLTYYYWARHVNTSGIAGPYNATAGTSTTANKILIGAEPVIWQAETNVYTTAYAATGGIAKSNYTAAWDAGAYSTYSVGSGNCFVQASFTDTTNLKAFIGLTPDPAGTNYTTCNYCFMVDRPAGNYKIYFNGTLMHTESVVPQNNDVISVSVEDGYVYFRLNATPITSFFVTVSYPLYVDCGLYNSGAAFSSVVWDRGNPGVYGFLLNGNVADGTITGLQLANLAVDTAHIADLAVTDAKIGSLSADKIVATTLSAITANMGALTVDDELTVASGGHLQGGQTAYGVGSGFWLGDDLGTWKFSIGDTASNSAMTWDGTTLRIRGEMYGKDYQATTTTEYMLAEYAPTVSAQSDYGVTVDVEVLAAEFIVTRYGTLTLKYEGSAQGIGTAYVGEIRTKVDGVTVYTWNPTVYCAGNPCNPIYVEHVHDFTVEPYQVVGVYVYSPNRPDGNNWTSVRNIELRNLFPTIEQLV